MPRHELEGLRERLLRAGVAPRHVRRYLRELLDHHDDALRAELTKGAPVAAAHEAAWARLGTAESLAQGMLERPELRSTAARFPALVFGVGPVLGWLVAPFAQPPRRGGARAARLSQPAPASQIGHGWKRCVRSDPRAVCTRRWR
jgi:hypothetical protein